MDRRHFFAVTRTRPVEPAVTTRRTALALSLGGVIAGLGRMDATARKKRKDKGKHKKKRCKATKPNACAGQNWCMDRSQTCGPEGGYGKCLVEATGGNVCAEILFQAASCAECESPSCSNCRCVLAAGGGDHCNNGASGYDFICVRAV